MGNFHLPCLITAGYLPKSIECACMLWDVIRCVSRVAWSRVDTGLYTHLYGFPFFDGWPSHLFHFLTMARMIWALNWSYPHWFPSYLLESRVPMIKQKRIGRVSKWPVNVWWTYEPSDGKWLFFGSFPAGNILEDLACLAARTHCRCLQYALVARCSVPSWDWKIWTQHGLFEPGTKHWVVSQESLLWRHVLVRLHVDLTIDEEINYVRKG
jgi:hypothetical protein